MVYSLIVGDVNGGRHPLFGLLMGLFSLFYRSIRDLSSREISLVLEFFKGFSGDVGRSVYVYGCNTPHK